MSDTEIGDLLLERPPFSEMSEEARTRVRETLTIRHHRADAQIYAPGTPLEGLHIVVSGTVEVRDPGGTLVSVVGRGDAFGERGLLRDGLAATRARATQATEIALLPRAEFDRLLKAEPAFRAFFAPSATRDTPQARLTADLTTLRIGEIMTPDPATVPPTMSVAAVATLLRERNISCVLVTEGGALVGIVTASDLVDRVLAEGRDPSTPVAEVMTRDPLSIDADALGHDAFLALVERRIGHFPVLRGGRLAGIVTRTNLLMRQSLSAALMVSEIARAPDVPAIAKVVKRIPELLAQLVGQGTEAHVVTRLVTDVGDAATRRLLALAEERLGPPPVPYLWLACGSQGRREQTGVSDQDNCLMLDDAATPGDDAYFEGLARFVSDGLDACGYFYCPGEMMATTPRWRQRIGVWRGYFASWVRTPDPMAQMLSSVMFDLRPIHGEAALFEGLQAETLRLARSNSIFVAHMVANALKNAPPLGLLGGLATIRSGEHKDTLDLKHAGVAPVVDIARIYALQAELRPVNTRERLIAAREAAVVSAAGAHDLLDAYDLLCEIRLKLQARQVREGRKPDNFMAPRMLSALERNHLRDAFVVVKTMQSALGQGRMVLT